MFADFSALPEALHVALASTLGLLVGSFLNVVIYRYPNLLKYQWSRQSYEWLHEKDYAESPPDGLLRPASRCGHCGAGIKPWHNIPVISFLLLRGKCASCQQSISLRYPLVEILTAGLSGIVMWQLGWTPQAAFALLLTWCLLALSFIDLDHQLLPDDIVLPVLWLGLGLSLVPLFANSVDAIIGAIAGYLSLWTVFQLFKLATGKEGMGYGDFKLLALLGAWLGWQFLPQIVLVSTVVGSIVGITLITSSRLGRDNPIPFGPYIAAAGWIAMIWGERINQTYLSSIGL